MKVTSKNGLKLEILPRNKWNPLDWYWCFEQANIIRNQNIYMNTEGWKFTYGSISEVHQ